jgi:hypothetical protein
MIRKIVFLFFICFYGISSAQIKLGVLQYNGGGDWYANPTSVANLITFANDNLACKIDPVYDYIEVGNTEISQYPFIHMTGHGNVVFSNDEASNLRNYLISGGFLHIDDNYGMDKFIRIELKKVFPELDLVELPVSHPIFNQKFSFPNGLPKVHEHDDNPPQAFGLIYEGRLVCLYTYECDLGDGWEDQNVHKDSDEIRKLALQMGTNILQYAFSN